MKSTVVRFLFLVLAALSAVLFSGCAGSAVAKLRKKIPIGYADSMDASVTTLGGWGGSIHGKGVESEGRGKLTADEYTETVNSPWATFHVSLVGAGVGQRRVQIKSDDDAK